MSIDHGWGSAIQRWIRLLRPALLVWLALCAASRAEAGQFGALVSPGLLSKAHESLKGGANCVKCHEVGRRVTTSRCLACHKPIEERIARKSGVHRNVTNDCVSCHAEHVGVDVPLRRIDAKTFDHAVETGYRLDGRHATIAQNCSACHKTHSFLDARADCSTCHADPHKGTLGATCTACHSTAVAFKQTRTQFDHSRARFTLTGAHTTVACEKCHTTAGKFRGVQFESCASCHQEPHKSRFGPTCTTCHTTERWATKTVEHGRTRFPLVGAHVRVACEKCHTTAIAKPIKFDTCSSCHVNVHKDSVKDDCRACHTEATFKKGTFDHAVRTGFALTAKHEGLECRKCHTSIVAADVPLSRKVVDFSGASTQCVSCHTDKHKGEFGVSCDACHRPSGFSVAGFKHPKEPDFYTGQHASVACVGCHGPRSRLQPTHAPSPTAQPGLASLAAQMQQSRAAPPPAAPVARPEQKTPSFECASCHADVHLGQLGASCDRCHAVDGVKFKAVRFSHDTAAFPLTGKHKPLECAMCHKPAVLAYPAATGAAVQFHPLSKDCRSCHQDPHLGQVDPQCETCHVTSTFKIAAYTHRGLDQFFAGNHGTLTCEACHKKETGRFPAGTGTALRLKVGRTCAACHPQF